jgi:hypothetical protein
VEKTIGDSTWATLLRASKYSSVREFREFNEYIEQKNIYNELFYREVRIDVYSLRTGLADFLNIPQVWDKQQFDAVIGPVQALPSLLHG